MLLIRAAEYDAFSQKNDPEHRTTSGGHELPSKLPWTASSTHGVDPMKLGLEGKTALITAASGGIGSGIAAALADAGVRVAVSGRTGATLEQVAGSLTSRAGGRPVIVVGDVCAQAGPAQIATEAARALGGRVDILVNNAGGARPATGEVDDAFWDEAMTLNFLAARRLTDLITPGMKAQNWGRIVNISGVVVAPKLNGAAPAK